MANIKSFLGAAGAVAVAALGLSSGARADGNTFGYSAILTVTSEYMFRGIALNNAQPAFQPFVELTYGNPNLTWYLDVWGSNTSNANCSAQCFGPYEVDVYGGVRPVYGSLAFDLGVLYYTNPQTRTNNVDYVEFKANAQYTGIKDWNIGITGYVTPDQGVNTPETETVEGNLSYTLPQFHIFTPTVGGILGWTNNSSQDGRFWFNGVDSYVYWNAGVKLAADKFWIDLRYWDTDISNSAAAAGGGFGRLSDSRFVGSFGVNLP